MDLGRELERAVSEATREIDGATVEVPVDRPIELREILMDEETRREYLRLKAMRPMTDAERAFIGGYALGKGVPDDWGFDDERCAFVEPLKAG